MGSLASWYLCVGSNRNINDDVVQRFPFEPFNA